MSMMESEEISSTEKRAFLRIPFREPVQYQLKGMDRWQGCLSYDIAEGGIRINVDDFIPLHKEVRIQVKLKNTVVDLTGYVSWMQQIPYGERYQVGLKFGENQLGLNLENDLRPLSGGTNR